MIIKRDIWINPYQTFRTLHIYLPDDRSVDERFPVLYMFDGHNLFNDSDATYGTSWGLKDYLDKAKTRLMVVGLECNHEGNERLSEFTPYDFYEDEWGIVRQKGRPLLEWMIHDLKDFIDKNYPTLPFRETTYIGGSSMGGTMALYAVMIHSIYYSKAICVSPHIYPMYKEFRKDFDKPMTPQTEVYMSWGGNEYYDLRTFAVVTDQNLQIIRALLKKPGVDVFPHVFKNDDHSEAAWKKELPVWMKELNIG
ncbi:MAG: alpha/beta hydrolase-fold protein [Erysipelotrichaceae bacterium]|nr:alpha/beta hydrolase-fold protein [Erysipelotrichaceae bacterium]